MKYLKAIYGAIFTALGAVETAYVQGNGTFTAHSIIAIAVAFFTALGVIWGVPNVVNSSGAGKTMMVARAVASLVGWQAYAKAIYAALLAGLGAVYTAYAQGAGSITGQTWIMVAITVLTTFGTVWGVPNGGAATSRP